MRKMYVAAAAAAVLVVALAPRLARAQDWQPPSRQMPQMPAMSELDGGWRGSLGAWFAGTGTAVAEVRAAGEAGGSRARMVRFLGGVRPVAVWTDRNGDGRCDMIEIFRGGARVAQLIDADYDGTANALRLYDASGALAREERL
jgi:hypothetical protein